MTNLLIPQHISKYGLYSAQFVIANSITAYYYKYYILASILCSLYITTLIHWNKLYRRSIVKTIDIILAVSSILSVTFIDSQKFTPFYIDLWNKSISISITAFIMNEFLLYYRLANLHFEENNYIYYIYYTSVFTHIIFLHILPNITCITCIIGSFYQNPSVGSEMI